MSRLCCCFFSVLLALGSTTSSGQRAVPDPTSTIDDGMPLDDYLGLLLQISPAAHEGAQAYLQAFQRRCGRALNTTQLRRAMSEGDGDPVLMAMIRASHLRDGQSLTQLGQQIACGRVSRR